MTANNSETLATEDETNTPPMQPNGTWLKEHVGETVEIDLPNRESYVVTVDEVNE